MSSKKLLFIISLVILASSLMSFNANPILNFDSNTSLVLVKTDTLPGNMQERVAELHRKREQIRKEVQRIKAAEEAKAAKKAQAEITALEKEQEKANKDAIAQIKAEEKAAKKAEADRLKAIKKQQREADAIKRAKVKAKEDAIAQKEREAKKIEAERLALKRKQQRDTEAALKAEQKAAANRLKTQQDGERQALRDKVAKAQENVNTTVSDEDALKAAKKRDAEIAKAAKKKEREALKAIKAKEREEKARRKAEAADIALSNPNISNEDALKAAKKREAELAKAAKQKEREALKAQRAKEREEKARQKAAAADIASNPNISNEDALKAAKKREAELAKAAKQKEREALKAQRAKEREEKARREAAAADIALSNPNISEEDALKAAKKRDAELAKAAKQKEREALRIARAKEREEKALLLARQKAAAAVAAEAGLVYDEDPPGQESTPNVSIPADPNENPGQQAKPIEVATNQGTGNNESKVITEPILPPPPANDATAEAPRDKTKDAVAKALKRGNKKKRRKGGIKLPGISNKSDISSEVILEECDFEFNEFDPITQKVKRGLSHRFFFSYTEDILKEYMQGEDYLVCTGGLIDIQGIIALEIEFIIDSPQARYEYGSIGSNAQLILQLIDGEIITLLSEQSDSGRINKATGKTEFSTIFLISPREEKTLRKTEISAVRMVWGTGYEDYEVNELDFLINQFQCIDAARDN